MFPFDDMVQLIDDENIVTCVDLNCGFAFYVEAPKKAEKINREEKKNSRFCEKPKFIPNNGHHNCSIVEHHTSIIFLNP